MDFENVDTRDQIKAIKEKARRRNSRMKKNHIVFWSFLVLVNLFLSGFNMNKFFTYVLIQLFTFLAVAILLLIASSKNKSKKKKKVTRRFEDSYEEENAYNYTEEDYFNELEYSNAFTGERDKEDNSSCFQPQSKSNFYNYETFKERTYSKNLDWRIEDQSNQTENSNSVEKNIIEEKRNPKTETEGIKKFQGGIHYASPYRPVSKVIEQKHKDGTSISQKDTEQDHKRIQEIHVMEENSSAFPVSFVPSSIQSISIPELEIKSRVNDRGFEKATMSLQEYSYSFRNKDILIDEILSSMKGKTSNIQESYTKENFTPKQGFILPDNNLEKENESIFSSPKSGYKTSNTEITIQDQDENSIEFQKSELDIKENETTIVNYSKVISLIEHVNKKKDHSEEELDELEALDEFEGLAEDLENIESSGDEDLNHHSHTKDNFLDKEAKESLTISHEDAGVVFEFDLENSFKLKPNICPEWGISPGHWTKVVSDWKKFQIPQMNDRTLLKQESLEIKSLLKEAQKTTGPKSYIPNREHYNHPQLDMLNDNPDKNIKTITEDDTLLKAEKLVDTLESFGVGTKIVNISKGPSITRFELQPDKGVKVSRIVNLADDIALNLEAASVRIEAPIPGKAAIGIEIPNGKITSVYLKEVIESPEFSFHPSKIAFAVGKDTAGNVVIADISQMPHLLIAGATGSGKSVCINTLIASILYKADPSEVKFIMIDPKVVELNVYNGVPHLLSPVVTDPKKAAVVLNWAVSEMNARYKLFAESGVRDLFGYNEFLIEKGDENTLPQIVIIIDELADLMLVAAKEVEDSICRLAQMARAAGMHIVIATQRPSVDVITGVIKANIPSRISFTVSSQVDSRTILDMAGAEKLVGKGDMLFSPIGVQKPVRVQGSFISDREVESIVNAVKFNSSQKFDQDLINQIQSYKEESPIENNTEDELFPEVVEIVLELGQASTSMIQRKLRIGYSRAARLMDQLEAWGIVSSADGSKPRNILISKEEWKELNKE